MGTIIKLNPPPDVVGTWTANHHLLLHATQFTWPHEVCEGSRNPYAMVEASQVVEKHRNDDPGRKLVKRQCNRRLRFWKKPESLALIIGCIPHHARICV